MKKFNKIVAGMMVVGMGANVLSAIPMQNLNKVNAETDSSFNIVIGENVFGFNRELEIGETVTLPTVAGVTREVKDPKGNDLTLEDNKLVADTIGTYTVRYIKDIENSDGKSIQEYKVVVAGEKPTLKFATNSSRIIPETIKTNYSKKIVLPVPEVLDGNGDKIENANVTVEINSPAETDIITVDNEQLTEENGYPLETSTEGTYVITYKYKDNNNLVASKTFTVEAQNNYDVSGRTLTHSLSGTMPTSINLGAKVTLPTVTAKDSDGNEVSVYYTIKAVNKASNQEYAVNDEDHTFVPMETGSYRITYTINDFYNSKFSGATNDNTFNYTIDSCTDTVAPVAQAVNNYTKTVVDGTVVKVAVDDIIDAKTNVVSKVYVNNSSTETVTFPAIFATDDYEVQEADGYYSYDTSKLKFVRRLLKNGTTLKTWASANVDTSEYTNVEHVNENEAVSYEFTGADAGSYKIVYSVKDGSGNSKETTYTFEVDNENLNDVSAPTITFDELNKKYAIAGQKISFKKPTVVDYVNNEADDKVVGDTRVETSTYYYFDEDVEHKVEIKEDKDNKDNLAFTLPKDISGKSTVTIITYAKDDINPQTSKTYKIKLVSTTNDHDAPTTSSALTLSGTTLNNSGLEATIDQLNTVSISDIVVTDADEYFGAKLVVRYFKNSEDEVGKNVSLSSLTTVYGEVDEFEKPIITLKNAKFEANNAGTYVITLISQDLAGNTLVKSTSIKAKDVVAPEMSIGTMPGSAEIGETVTLPKITVTDDGKTLDNKPVIEVEGPSGYVLNGYDFTAYEKGDYKFKFTAKDDSNNKVESDVYTIHVEDTTKPTIELLDNFPQVSKLDEVVVLPDFVASDASGINFKETKVTVKNKNGNTVTVEHTENGWEFTPKENGAYVATYKAVDNTGLVYEEEHTIKCGDVTAPTITIGNEKVNKPGSKKVGDKLELDLDSITISDAGDSRFTVVENGESREITFKEAMAEDSALKNNVKVKLYDPNNNLVSLTKEDDAEYYKLTEQGTYKIVYYAKDAGENETTDSLYSHSFTVNAKTTTAGISTQTLGIILIVASLLLLGGVIVYFFATRKVVRRPKNKGEN